MARRLRWPPRSARFRSPCAAPTTSAKAGPPPRRTRSASTTCRLKARAAARSRNNHPNAPRVPPPLALSAPADPRSRSCAASPPTALLSPANSPGANQKMRAASFIAALLSVGLLFQTAAQAQTTEARAQAASTGSLGLPVGGSHILRFDRPVGRIYLGNSEVADVIAVTDRSIYLLGKRVGTSSLTIMERGE